MVVVDRRYHIKKQINEGGIGRIFLAYDSRLKNDVVLKCVDGTDQDIEEVRAEAEILTKLHHAHLPKVIDFVKGPGGIYTVMEFIRGHSFKEYLDKGIMFSEGEIIRWSIEICNTLDYLHRQNPPIIHSDLKPGNIMLMSDGNIFVIDFNISSRISNDSSAQVIGATMGYAPPEQIMACKYGDSSYRIDARADIYSFGATIYHLLTGIKIKTDKKGNVMHLSNLNQNVSPVLANIVMKCLEPDPKNRYQDVRELRSALSNVYFDDGRYRKLLRRQKIIHGLTIAGIFFFLLIAVAGGVQYRVEQKNIYLDLAENIDSNTSHDVMEEAFLEAVDKNSSLLDAYYYKAKWLYDRRNNEPGYVDMCINFIESEAVNTERKGSSAMYAELYYILGNLYLDTESYADAKDAFDNAIERNPEEAYYYVGLVRAEMNRGNTEEALEALELAQDYGLSNNEADMLEEEIVQSSITIY